ncbi:MAG: outer membrane beta-barrel protein [Rikenellaceae bacterium]|nr:outer membrane beta-barrel protein [Rikenellaceae bacterium]
MTEKDHIEELLHRKLHDHGQEPPQEVWTHIARSLEAGAVPPAPAPRRKLWRIAAAVTSAAAMLTAALLLVPSVEPPAEHLASVAPRQQDDRQAVERLIGSAITVDDLSRKLQGRETPSAHRSAPQVPYTETARLIAADAPAAEESADPTPAEIIRAATRTDERPPHRGESQPVPEAVPGRDRAGYSPSPQWETLAELKRRRTRRPKPGLSLYALNSSGIRTGGNGTPRPIVMATAPQAISVVNDHSILMKSGTRTPRQAIKMHHKYPVTVGIGIDYPLSARFSLESGVTYSYLQSTSATFTQQVSDYRLRQELHYIGIPLKLNYRLVDTPRFGFYAGAGGMLEKGVRGTRTTTILTRGTTAKERTSFKVEGVQPSVGASLGVEYKPAELVSIYLEPGISYYFDNSQPDNYRTEHPLNFSLKAGVRFNLSK